jgi:Na+-transporting NADH:ubiquinone oxidoreductase subunit NqrC
VKSRNHRAVHRALLRRHLSGVRRAGVDAAVSLRERQQANAELDRKVNVLRAAGVMREDEVLPREEVEGGSPRSRSLRSTCAPGRRTVEFDPLRATIHGGRRPIR